MFAIHSVMGLSCLVRLTHFIRNNNYIDQLVILCREIQWLNTLENWSARGTLSQIVILLVMIGFFMQQTTVNNGKKREAAGYPFVWSQVVLYCIKMSVPKSMIFIALTNVERSQRGVVAWQCRYTVCNISLALNKQIIL